MRLLKRLLIKYHKDVDQKNIIKIVHHIINGDEILK